MPNRILKESICTSEDIAALSMGAEILFYRLMVKCDDFGAYFGNEQIIKSTCFPLKSNDIKCSQVQSWIEELVKTGLIQAYIADDGKKYIQIAKWSKHQQVRAKRRKFPALDSNCLQMIASDCNSPRNPIQSNPIQSNPRKALRIESESDLDLFFESVWKLYPKKRDKSHVSKKSKRELMDAGFDVVSKAIAAYVAEIEAEHREERYIKNGSTFFNGAWKEYVSVEESAPASNGEYDENGVLVVGY